MSVSLKEIISSAGYNVESYDDAHKVLGILNQEDVEELRDKCCEVIEKVELDNLGDDDE